MYLRITWVIPLPTSVVTHVPRCSVRDATGNDVHPLQILRSMVGGFIDIGKSAYQHGSLHDSPVIQPDQLTSLRGSGEKKAASA